MSTIGNKAPESYVTVQKQTITGNGGTSYTLSQVVSTATDIEVFVNNTRQEPIVAYNVSSTTLTMTGVINSSDSFYVIFQGKGITSVNHPPQSPITATSATLTGNITTSGNATLTGNITTSGTLNTPSINGGQIGGRRNIIINGAMKIKQRGSATFNHAATGTANLYGLDRFQFQSTGLDQLEGTIAQAADAPVGFANSLKWTTTEPESAIAAAETFDCCQKIEAQDLQQLAFGTSSAKNLTLRFYVKSSVAGTYGINVFKADSTARQLTSTYTISSANTWEEKTINIPADTNSGGTIADDVGEGLRITWHLGTGSNFTSANNALTWANYADAGWAFGHAQNNVALTDNATWQLTGVQLEVGSQATSFENRSFGEELGLCQRYFQSVMTGANNVNSAASIGMNPQFFQPMRATPAVGQEGVFNVNNRTSNQSQSSAHISLYAGDTRGVAINMQNFSSLVLDAPVIARYQNTNGITLDAEL